MSTLNKHTTTAAPSTAAVQLLDPNSSRVSLLIQNVGTVDAWLKEDSTVAAGTGIKLAAGATMSDPAPSCSQDSWYAVTASGTADLRIVEVF